jgi:hypothetical protein
MTIALAAGPLIGLGTGALEAVRTDVDNAVATRPGLPLSHATIGQMCDRVCLLVRGRLEAEGDPGTVVARYRKVVSAVEILA